MLVTAMALQRLPAIEVMSAFEIPSHDEAKLICQDLWVSIAVAIITILGVPVYLYRSYSKLTFFRGYLYDNVCTVFLYISHNCYHVPLKLHDLSGLLYMFTIKGQIKSKTYRH